MKKKTDKQLLFERMEAVNPDFKMNEISYEDAKDGSAEYDQKIKEVLSQFDNQTIEIHYYNNIEPAVTNVITTINTYNREEPYNILVMLSVKERGQNIMVIKLFENIKLENVLWKYSNGIFVDAPILDEFAKFIRMGAPYAKINEPAFIEQIIDEMYRKFGQQTD